MDARKNLVKLDDSTLRKIEKRLYKAIDGNCSTIDILRKRADEGYESIKKIYRLSHKIQWVIGKRKGENCPALKTQPLLSFKKRITTYYGCGADDGHRLNMSYHFFHRCARCPLSKKQAMNKMVFKNVFQAK